MRTCKRGHEMPPVGLCKPCASIRASEFHARRVASETPEQREERLAKRRVIGRRFTANHPGAHARRMESPDGRHPRSAVRPLQPCGLGFYRDDPDLLVRASEYLRESRVNKAVS